MGGSQSDAVKANNMVNFKTDYRKTEEARKRGCTRGLFVRSASICTSSRTKGKLQSEALLQLVASKDYMVVRGGGFNQMTDSSDQP